MLIHSQVVIIPGLQSGREALDGEWLIRTAVCKVCKGLIVRHAGVKDTSE